MRYGAQSEYGPLKTLLLHRPQPDELRWVQEHTLRYYNFISPVDPDAYLTEYDAMVEAIAAQGVELIFLTEVLKHHSEALTYLARRPNLVFMRDMATVYDQGAVIMNPFLKGRQWDGWVVQECFKILGIPVLGEITYPGYLEGGSNVFITDRIGAVGLCDRATEAGINQLAALTLGQSLDELLVVNVPPGVIHLDSLLMVVDKDLVFLSAAELDISPTKVLRKDGSVEYVWLEEYLQGLGFECEHGSKDLDMSYMACAPRCVIGYAHTVSNVPAIEGRGGRFIGIPGLELSKGDGGVHCMTCPILRE